MRDARVLRAVLGLLFLTASLTLTGCHGGGGGGGGGDDGGGFDVSVPYDPGPPPDDTSSPPPDNGGSPDTCDAAKMRHHNAGHLNYPAAAAIVSSAVFIALMRGSPSIP